MLLDIVLYYFACGVICLGLCFWELIDFKRNASELEEFSNLGKIVVMMLTGFLIVIAWPQLAYAVVKGLFEKEEIE